MRNSFLLATVNVTSASKPVMLGWFNKLLLAMAHKHGGKVPESPPDIRDHV